MLERSADFLILEQKELIFRIVAASAGMKCGLETKE
jgi:hypothetical protein